MVTLRPMPVGIATPVRKPKFSGDYSTEMAQSRLLSVKELKAAIDDDVDTYVGHTPDPLITLGIPQNALVKRIDWLVRNLVPATSSPTTPVLDKKPSLSFLRKAFTMNEGQNKNAAPSLRPVKSWANFKNSLGMKSTSSFVPPVPRRPESSQFASDLGLGHELRLAESGAGVAGKVFRLTVKGQELDRLALKIFKDEDNDIYRETAAGMFFTAQPTQDLSALYMAHPKMRWTLMEFIEPGTRLEDRPGKTMLEQGYHLSDNNAKNYVNGIRVDHGGIVSKVKPLSGNKYQQTAIMMPDGWIELKKPGVIKINPVRS